MILGIFRMIWQLRKFYFFYFFYSILKCYLLSSKCIFFVYVRFFLSSYDGLKIHFFEVFGPRIRLDMRAWRMYALLRFIKCVSSSVHNSVKKNRTETNEEGILKVKDSNLRWSRRIWKNKISLTTETILVRHILLLFYIFYCRNYIQLIQHM